MGLALKLFMLAEAVTSAPKPVDPNGQVYAAIWYDLQLNAFIGNSSRVAALWYEGVGTLDEADGKKRYIEDLTCNALPHPKKCSFTLRREGGPVESRDGDRAPDIVRCTARFASEKEQLKVIHIPPRRGSGGHSITTLQCRPGSGN